MMEAIQNTMRPFKDVTVIMSSEHTSTASLIRSLHITPMNGCRSNTEYDNTAHHEMRMTMLHDLEKRYNSLEL